MSATYDLISCDSNLVVVDDGADGYHRLHQTNAASAQLGDPTGIHTEEGEFLYGLIRVLRPETVLETGTNIGVSTRYIALALEHNKKGIVYTIEHDATVCSFATDVFGAAGLIHRIIPLCCKVETITLRGMFDFMWLDTELAIRYGELLRFLPQLAPGGIVCIHDLWELDCPGFGGVPDLLKDHIRSGFVRVIPIKTTHGVTMFQRAFETDYIKQNIVGGSGNE